MVNSITCQPKIKNKVNNWLGIIQDSLFPPTCIFCDAAGFHSMDICQPCMQDCELNIPRCAQCAMSFEIDTLNSLLCGKCQHQSPFFDHAFVPFRYQSYIKYLISALKYRRDYKVARLLGQLFVQTLSTEHSIPDLIIPVPLHKNRMRQRGFNQALAICHTISKLLNVPIDSKSIIRTKDTPHQIGLSAKQRQHNIKDAFKINHTFLAQHIVIFDDVVTTGSTANELAKLLKTAGVPKVDLWGCARA